MLARLGSDCLAIGSDFDGAYVPDTLNSADCVPTLLQGLQDRGHSQADLQKIFCDNWLRVFDTACPPVPVQY